METSDFDYVLPEEFIAQKPVEPRDSSRLMVLDRNRNTFEHVFFYELGRFVNPGDVLVLNETRVIPARLYARKIPTGGKVELLLLNRLDETSWEVLVGGKGMVAGKHLQVEGGPIVQVEAVLDGSRRLVRFEESVEPMLEEIGHVPLPPYIHEPLLNSERYQTVYARKKGSAAAPTAGLHFTPSLINSLQGAGVRFANVTLHVGLDTFAPVTEEFPEKHKIHKEWCQVGRETAENVNEAYRMGKRIIAVGTTSVRALESAAGYKKEGDLIGIFEGFTGLYILPGYSFRALDAMITNFHLPRSTLLMMVSAFAGKDRILEAYEVAKRMKYRFYSFGDAMIII
jgi:S-adenosylmethionine:tRNA ribosyltransferase-isomerase